MCRASMLTASQAEHVGDTLSSDACYDRGSTFGLKMVPEGRDSLTQNRRKRKLAISFCMILVVYPIGQMGFFIGCSSLCFLQNIFLSEVLKLPT